MEIRNAKSSDLEAVLRLWEEAEAEPTDTDDQHSLAVLLERDPSALLIAVDAGRIVGSVICGWDGWRGSIYRLAVAPSHRRTGLAGRLVAAAEEHLRSAGAARLQAIVVSTDPDAMAFWRSTGWQEQSARTRFVRTTGRTS